MNDINQLNHENIRLKPLIRMQDTTLENIYIRNTFLEEQEVELSKQISYLKSIIKSYELSSSWRVTSPCRALKRLLRHFRLVN